MSSQSSAAASLSSALARVQNLKRSISDAAIHASHLPPTLTEVQVLSNITVSDPSESEECALARDRAVVKLELESWLDSGVIQDDGLVSFDIMQFWSLQVSILAGLLHFHR